MVQVPAVTGMSEQGASSILRNAGLKATVTHVRQGADTTGQVISQNPSDGSSVPAGSAVTITVNDGPKKITVPSDLVGMTEANARKALVAAGFADTDINVTYQQTDSATEGTVVSSTPNPGAQASEGDTVTIVVAQAAPAPATVTTTTTSSTQPDQQQSENPATSAPASTAPAPTESSSDTTNGGPTGGSSANTPS
ncbi:MAG: PASTA domain-containing protein [Acidipropionibacterium sp.]|nr:PASTA domain-containing protein [Acidipropionibacterium sp.]